ncbi:hypothetical protein CKC63_24195 [Salmonella enterica]|nr:hypothetical protein [Salmonella enterica]EIE4158512.1 hypothetical protein [Salmonella enterica]
MPLPLREYYPINRATELLDCTIDDLICWGEFGKIKLCLKCFLLDAFCFFDFEIFNEIIKDFNLQKKKIKGNMDEYINAYFTVYDRYMEDQIDFIGKIKNKSYGGAACTLLIGCSESEISSIICDPHLILSDGANYKFNPGIPSFFKIPVQIHGFFPLNKSFYRYRDAFPKGKEYKHGCMTSLDFSAYIYAINKERFSVDDLFILKDDFIKIMEASKKGCELTTIPGFNCYNELIENEVIYTDKRNKDARNSAASIKIAKALIINYHPDTKNNPAKLAMILEEEIRKAGLGDFSVSKDTISRWMKEV